MDIDEVEEYQRDSQFDDMKNEVFLYLEELRESGEINMFGAPSHVMETFEMDKTMAIKFVAAWMELNGIGQDFVGRPHRMIDDKNGKLVDAFLKLMLKKKKAILSMSESVVNEVKLTEDYKNSEWEVYVADENGKEKIVKKAKSKRAGVILYNKLINSDKYHEVGMRVVKESVNEAKYKGYDWKRQNRKDGHPLIVPALQKTFANMKDLKKYIDKHGTMESVNEGKNIGHYERVGNQTIVDSNFVNYSKGVLPNSELVHLGMGDFAVKSPKGTIEFRRSGNGYKDA